jgi:hypothetical protein
LERRLLARIVGPNLKSRNDLLIYVSTLLVGEHSAKRAISDDRESEQDDFRPIE